MKTDKKFIPRILVGEKDENTLSLFESIFNHSMFYDDMEKRFSVTFSSSFNGAMGAFSKAHLTDNPFIISFIDIESHKHKDTGIHLSDALRDMDNSLEIVIMAHFLSREHYLENIRLKHPPNKIYLMSKPCDALEIYQMARVLSSKWVQEKKLSNILGQLKTTNKIAENLNYAMSHLSDNMKTNRNELKQQIAVKMISTIMPIIKTLKTKLSGGSNIVELDMIEHHIGELLQGHNNINKNTNDFTSSELKIACMIKKGFSNKKIASMLFVSTNTIKTHRKNIRRKLGISNSSVNLKLYLSSHMHLLLETNLKDS